MTSVARNSRHKVRVAGFRSMANEVAPAFASVLLGKIWLADVSKTTQAPGYERETFEPGEDHETVEQNRPRYRRNFRHRT
jgi:hypothetical protein